MANWLVVLLAWPCWVLAQAPSPAGMGTGGKEDSPEGKEWLKKHCPMVKAYKLNTLALERINKHRKRTGLRELTAAEAGAVPVGQEAVFADVAGAGLTEAAGIAGTGAGDILPMAGGLFWVDNSMEIWFPPIRSQGGIGSCTCWSVNYYAMTYEVCRLMGWSAQNGDDTRIFSPKWTYNMINGGVDGGSSAGTAISVLMSHGAVTWSEFPYDWDYLGWCLNPEAWKKAIRWRTASYSTINPSSWISNLKTALLNGNVVPFRTYVNSWVSTQVLDNPATTNDQPWVGQWICPYMGGTDGAHYMTFVGYNDEIWCDINGNGVVDSGEKGAFKLANSWGGGDWNGGYRWVSYDAFGSSSAVSPAPSQPGRLAVATDAYCLTARDHLAKAYGKFTVNHARRSEMYMQLGISTTGSSSPTTYFTPSGLTYDGGAYAFDGSGTARDGTFYLDFSDLNPSQGSTYKFWVSGRDTASGSPLTLKSFAVVDSWGQEYPADSANYNPLNGIVDNATALAYVPWTFSINPPESALVKVAAADASASEYGPDTGTFTVTRVDPVTGAGLTSGSMNVVFSLSGGAGQGTDYQTIGTNVTIAAGYSNATITVTPLQDTAIEGTETVVITVQKVTGSYFVQGAFCSATVDLLDDDCSVSIGATDPTAGESGADTGTFTVTRSGGIDGPLTVNYVVDPASTASNADYQTLSGIVSFGSGQATAAITLTPVDDATPELDETVIVRLQASANYAVGSPSVATVAIVGNDNAAPVVNISSPSSAFVGVSGTVTRILVEATVTDDGNPPPAALARVWSQMSGSGTVVFGNSNSPNTTVDIAGEGPHVLRLTATDGWAVGYDEVTVLMTTNVATIMPGGGITREWWLGIGGTAVSDLTGSGNYPNNPSGSQVESLFEGPVNWADNYGTRMHGYFVPSQSGAHLFYIASDDNSELYLSTDESPANVTKITGVPAWLNSRDWTYSSGSIALQAGNAYYICALQKEAGGGDNIAVGVDFPDSSQHRPIEGAYLAPYSATPGNFSPLVSAGPDVDISTALGCTLGGSVVDDGNPSDTIIATWAQISGPGTVVFADVHAAQTPISCATPGVYVLRLTADDSAIKTCDELTLTVISANPGATIMETGGITRVKEGGFTDYYLIRLNTQPTAPVTVAMSCDASQLTVSPASIIFSTSDWSTMRTCTVTAVDDALPEGPHTRTISHAASSTDGNYNGVSIAGTVVQIVDNDLNNPPVAANDAATVGEDSGANTIGVLVNDSDIDDDPLTVSAVRQGAHGTVAIGGGGANVSYAPALNYYGADSFTYTLTDGRGGYSTGTVSVTVTAVNDPPVAVNDSATVAEDSGANTINVLSNDSDVEGDVPGVSAVTPGAHGTVVIVGGGTAVTYAPAADYSGADSFTYTVSDGRGGTAVGTVSVTITPVNDAPAAQNQSATTERNTPIKVTLAASDVDGDALTFHVQSGPSHGALLGTAPNLVYVPGTGYTGSDALTFTANDGQANSGVGTVTLDVTAPFEAKIDFEPSTSPIPSGYQMDCGDVYGPGGGYGWTRDNSANMYASSGNPDERYNTYAIMNPAGQAVTPWNIALPRAGIFTVVVGAGNPQDTSSRHQIVVEGVTVIDATASSGVRNFTSTNVITVNDGQLSVTSGASATAKKNAICYIDISNIANHAPVVEAGRDLAVSSRIFDLNGVAADDGLPQGSSLTTTWSKISGPGSVAFTNAGVVSTRVTVSTEGSYILRLTTTDGALQSYDEVNVTVSAVTSYEVWQQMYFTAEQLANLEIGGDNADPDLDGMKNLDEYHAGTIPTNRLSVLRLGDSAFRTPSSEFVIRWQSAAGKYYTVQAATSLLSGFNLNLRTNVCAVPPENVHTDSVEGVGMRFYKVKLETGD